MPPLSYLHGKQMTPIGLMNNAGSNIKNIVHSVGIFSDNVATNIMRMDNQSS